MKRTLFLLMAMVMLLTASLALAEEVRISSFIITVPEGWKVTEQSKDNYVLESDAGVRILRMQGISLLASVPEEQRQIVSLALSVYDDDTLLEMVKPMFDEMYNTVCRIETVNGRKALYASVSSGGVDGALLIMVHKENILLTMGVNLLGDSAALCREAGSWISITDEPATADVVTAEAEIDAPEAGQLRTYTVKNGLMTITLDEDKYNVFTTSNAATGKSVQRSGITADRWDLYMSLGNRELMIAPVDKDAVSYSVCVRIKEDKYPELGNLKTTSPFMRSLFLDGLIAGFASAGTTEYETYETTQALYCVFDCKMLSGYEKRYATIYDDDMIYIWLASDAPLTSEDEAFLKEIVDAFVYR